MHGRPRNPSKPEDEEASAAKASKLRPLQSQFLHNHHSKLYDKEALELSAKLLEINPEFYTAWNYRKLAVEHCLSQPGSDPESILNEELRVVECALRQNFKSYGAWYHRKWVLSKGHSSVDHEMRLLDKFQKADPRNFHAWNYRRFVAALKNISEEDELKYTTDMIERNFSNYSAWHNRSILLSNLLKRKAEVFPKEKILSEEYELVHQAIFTDPDDQSGWFYHLWLLEQTVTKDSPWLISCWPASGSELIISDSKSASSCTGSPFSSYFSDGVEMPVILYFNQAVKGVNTFTVNVRSVFAESKDLVWRPLSLNNFGSAQAWVAFLKFSEVKIDYSMSYEVEVSLGDSSGIVSLNGCPLTHAFQSKFMVQFQQPNSQKTEGQNIGSISWEDSNFQNYEGSPEQCNIIPPCIQLKMDKDHEPIASKWQVDILMNEIELFRELLSAADCKIGKLTLARLLTALDTLMLYNNTSNSCQMPHTEEILALYTDLMKLDPSHSQYYREEHGLTFLRQVSCSKENLLRYCWLYRNSELSDNRNLVCLRLNNLSLARVGSIENLLWVQMLDLSHNELRSIEGLEAMQLLSCLNLSNNKIKSFTALDPLRHLKSLKVLNISQNEIGKHSIDTTRYLCSSPLSHAEVSDWKKSGLWSTDDAQLSKYWEAFLVFKGLTLVELGITGNAVVNEDFRSFLLKILPTLKRLDDTSL